MNAAIVALILVSLSIPLPMPFGLIAALLGSLVTLAAVRPALAFFLGMAANLLSLMSVLFYNTGQTIFLLGTPIIAVIGLGILHVLIAIGVTLFGSKATPNGPTRLPPR